jgi:hypothetical protein
MPSVSLSPILNAQVVRDDGAPASGWKIYSYVAGSTTPQPAYTDATGTVAQSNPIILDASGFPTQGQLWLEDGQFYKFVLTDQNDVSRRTFNEISGVNDPSQVSADQWQDIGTIATFVSAQSFSLVGDQVGEYHVGRRVQLKQGVSFVYGYITASSYSLLNQLTTVTVKLDSAATLTNALSQSNLSLLRADHHALPKIDYELNSLLVNSITLSGALNQAPQVTLPSASTVDIGAAASNSILITGTTTINSFGTAAAGILRMVEFQSALTVTYNATSMQLPGNANFLAQAGDVLFAYSKGAGNWKIVGYTLSSGSSIQQSAVSQLQVFATPGSFNFTVPNGVSRLKVTVTGGGQTSHLDAVTGIGGTSGATAIKWISGLTSGQVIPLVVGDRGGTASEDNGQDSSFGGFCTAQGGRINGATATGGDINVAGELGTSWTISAGVTATAYGGGGIWGRNSFGAGGTTPVTGTITPPPRGNPGIVIVEW